VAAGRPLKICLATSEFAPLAKTGGLADVAAALSAYLHRQGHDVRVLMPAYATLNQKGLDRRPVEGLQDLPLRIGPNEGHVSIDALTLPDSGLQVFLLRCPALYDRPGLYTQDDDEHLRFIVLSRAAIEMCQHMGFAPDIFSCHDWHTALIPLYLKSVYSWDRLFANTRSVLSIHNIGYQGVFAANRLPDLGMEGCEHLLHQDDLGHGFINLMKTGVMYADYLTTVSPTYAREIQGDEFGMGLQHYLRDRGDVLAGILNGVDDGEWNPETDTLIPANFSAQDFSGKRACKEKLMQDLGLTVNLQRLLFGIVTRLVSQKGIDLLQAVLPRLLQQQDFALTVLGSGEPRYEGFFQWLHEKLPDRVHFYRGYNNELAHRIEAGSDAFLMPSLYEPCGLNQMYSLKYGTIPVVRETGGLADSVEQIDPRTGAGTGVLFRDYNEQGLTWAIEATLTLWRDQDLWQQIMRNGMARDYSWERQGEQYVTLFRKLTGEA
jgi:starch synthase